MGDLGNRVKTTTQARTKPTPAVPPACGGVPLKSKKSPYDWRTNHNGIIKEGVGV